MKRRILSVICALLTLISSVLFPAAVFAAQEINFSVDHITVNSKKRYGATTEELNMIAKELLPKESSYKIKKSFFSNEYIVWNDLSFNNYEINVPEKGNIQLLKINIEEES